MIRVDWIGPPQMQEDVMPLVSPSQRIMMISTHGYVGTEPEFGKPDTGGQVVFVLELSR